MVVTNEPPLAAFIPDLFGRREFRGVSFHAATPPRDFDPTGRRVAVLGADSNAGRLIETMVGSAAQVKVFPLPPRRVVPRSRRFARFARRRSATVITSPFEEVTTAGVRTADGVHHDADVVVYGTGFAVGGGAAPLVGPGGRTLRQLWIDGAEPYLGVALHGLPNYFTLGGPDRQAALQSVIVCLRIAAGNTRIEVRRSTQQVFNERAHLIGPSPRPRASAFDLTPSLDATGDVYDGAATLTLAGTCQQVRVRLAGHLDPIDGQYHWQGTVFDTLAEDLVNQSRTVSLAVGDRNTPARITEKTPQGTHSIAGVGPPPFALANVLPRA
ncbi:DUF4873 domain-containing protein [Mycobacterium cookii]|uniref:DUF4873 domain-containing protein n=1 Tax=Mycobacterium cookii TaxID=1775 RepID=UPI0035592E48